jgi:hypothetical protein
MRWGLGRLRFSIAPGLYAIGDPDGQSDVVVTANYKMTFDLLRRALDGRNLWILVLDTKGINVWCAAGKGTFGTTELVNRVKSVQLDQIVAHRRLIVPQLGAVGVSAHAVKKGSGFAVVYGPVRAEDLPAFLDSGCQASQAMRRVSFGAYERLVLTPVELVNAWKQILWSAAALLILGGFGPGVFSLDGLWTRGWPAVLTALSGLLIGAVLVPVFLPWIPGRAFALKGAIAGFLSAIAALVLWHGSLTWLNGLALTLALTAASSWFAMHFTGSTTFTSPSGVEKEMRRAIPAQAAALLIAGGCWLTGAF